MEWTVSGQFSGEESSRGPCLFEEVKGTVRVWEETRILSEQRSDVAWKVVLPMLEMVVDLEAIRTSIRTLCHSSHLWVPIDLT